MAVPDLSEKALSGWLKLLPADAREAIEDGDPVSGDGGTLATSLVSVAAWQVPDLVRQHPDDAKVFGRARRIRLMAWMSAEARDNRGPLFRRLVGEDDETSGGAGTDEIGLLFLEDIRALNDKMVAPRLSQRMASENSLDAVVEAAFTLESDMAFRAGGV